ncbi:CopD family protein [Rhizobium sp. BT-175]|uniref:CopD family protein n=1 Tax=Rhizobium sp. BT-175 TaxID=2986929 RepID=UPI003557EFCA
MVYVWIKALHVAVVLVWAGGLLAQSMVLSSLSRSPSDQSTLLANRLRRWDSRVTSPALLLVWTLGISLAVLGQSFGEAWLMFKLGLVIFLSGLHGIKAGILRGAVVSGKAPPSWTRWSPVVSSAALGVIAILAVAKPF